MKNRFFHAFTLIEIVVVLIISSLVLLIGFRLYLTFQKTFRKKMEQQQMNERVNRFYTQLVKRVDQAEYIYMDGQKLLIRKRDDHEIVYRFDETGIIRQIGSSSDTLHVTVKNFRQQQVQGTNRLVWGFSFVILTRNGRAYPVMCSKTYSSGTLYQIERNDNGY